MKIEDVKKCKVALTHAAKFHADDVFGAAFLKVINPDIEIKRVNSVPESFDGIVFDIGLGKFDHHSVDNEKRENGIPFAAFGKLWREFAPSLYGEYVYKKIDKKLIESLDLSDNTGSYNALALAIDVLNPILKTDDGDFEFSEAVKFAKVILERMILKEKNHLKDLKKLKKCYEESADKRIIILNEHLYFQDYLPETEAIYVIYPSHRGGYCAQGIPKNSDTKDLKKEFPEAWLHKLPPYLRFCHTSRFLIAANNFEDILYACKEALK